MALNRHGLRSFAWAVTAALALAWTAPAVRAVNVLPLGDSITVGWGWPNGSTTSNSNGGYRYFLDGLLDGGFNFIGNRQIGTLSFDKDNWSQAGAKAQHDNGGGVASILRAVHNITQAGAPADLRAYNPANGKADAVLLMIGTNSDLSSTAQVNAAYNELNALMHGGPVNATGTSYGNIASATGLKAQMASAAAANPNAHVFIANILPGTYTSTHNHANTVAYTNATADYNARIRNTLLPTLTGTTTTYHYVDMFSVRVGELNLAWLANTFTGGSQSALLNLISPESDGTIDYVDWVRGGWNEAAWDDGVSGAAQSPTSAASVNLDLLPDRVHPSGLAYGIITNVWFNALQQAGLGGMYRLAGDANNDGIVNELDLLTVEDRMGQLAPAGTYLWGDANGDGRVDGADYLAVERYWGSTWASGPIPEPATAALLALAALGAAARPRALNILDRRG